MIHQHNWKNKVQIDSPNWTHLISVFPFPQMFLKASFKSWSVHITSASQQTCKDFIRQEVKSSCCLFWKSEKSIAILQNSWFFPFYSSSLIWETRDKIFILTNKKKERRKNKVPFSQIFAILLTSLLLSSTCHHTGEFWRTRWSHSSSCDPSRR